MRVKYIPVLFIVLLIFPSFAFSSSGTREEAMQQTLDRLKQESSPQIPSSLERVPVETGFNSEVFSRRQNIIRKTLDEIEIAVRVKTGYLTGDTTYDFDNHTSELMFPMDNWMAGADLTISAKNLSFNTEIWGSLEKDVGPEMTDKDWLSSVLISSTESTAEMDAVIWDISGRYDFYNKFLRSNIESLKLSTADEIKLGAVLGYRYERFDFDLYDLYNVLTSQTSYAGKLVGTYKVEYSLPYIGLAFDVLRKNYGFSMSLKYFLYPTAEDVDNHLLRALTFYGDYDEPDTDAWMFGINAFWEFRQNWKLNLGLEGIDLKISGTTWEQAGDPAWNKDQFTDTRQLLFWAGLQYRF